MTRAAKYRRSPTKKRVNTRNTVHTAMIASCCDAGWSKSENWPYGGVPAGEMAVVEDMELLATVVTVNHTGRKKKSQTYVEES